MGLVVDAEIIKDFFQETILGMEHELTGSASKIFDSNFRRHVVHVDNRGTIQHEWRSVVEPEWFDAWYAGLVMDGVVLEIDAPADKNLRKELLGLGFPSSGRDIWYARVCSTLSNRVGFAILISEDLDFYEPKEKRADSKRRTEILLKELGSVRRYFRRRRDTHIKSVARFLTDYDQFQ